MSNISNIFDFNSVPVIQFRYGYNTKTNSYNTHLVTPKPQGEKGINKEINKEINKMSTSPTSSSKDFVVVCPPVQDGREPTKVMGDAKMYLTQNVFGGRQMSRIEVAKGWDWSKEAGPRLPGCPKWCPATHLGTWKRGAWKLRSKMVLKVVVNQGETYCVPPGHLPNFKEDTVMIEFSQDTTYTNEKFLKA